MGDAGERGSEQAWAARVSLRNTAGRGAVTESHILYDPLYVKHPDG